LALALIRAIKCSFSGGTEKSRHLVSFNYLDNVGIIRPARFNRFSLRMNMDNRPDQMAEGGYEREYASLHDRKTRPTMPVPGRGGVIMSALNTPPFLSIYKKDGSGQYHPNPFQPSWETRWRTWKVRIKKPPIFVSSEISTPKQSLSDGFSLKTNVGIDLNTHQWDYYLDPFRTNFGRNQNGFGQADKSNSSTWLWENTANYARSFGNHNLTLLGGSSIQRYRWDGSFISATTSPTMQA
jgi:hypothetical protein